MVSECHCDGDLDTSLEGWGRIFEAGKNRCAAAMLITTMPMDSYMRGRTAACFKV